MSKDIAVVNPDKHAAVSKRFLVRQYGCNIPSNAHRAEDAYQTAEVKVGKTKYHIAAVADGCTAMSAERAGNSCRTDFGSRWFVDLFCEQAKKALALQGDNEPLEKTMKDLVLGCLRAMPSYQPRSSTAKVNVWHGKNISDELITTFYAYISGKQDTVLFLAGNGVVVCNGKTYTVSQVNGDMYPVYLHVFPESEWDRLFNEMFTLFSIPTADIGTLTIGTDGLSDCSHALESLSQNPYKPEEAKSYAKSCHRSSYRGEKKEFNPEITSDLDYFYHTSCDDDLTFVSLQLSRKAQATPIDLSVYVKQLSAVDRDKILSLRPAAKKNVPANGNKAKHGEPKLVFCGEEAKLSDYGQGGKYEDLTFFGSSELWYFRIGHGKHQGDLVKSFTAAGLAKEACNRVSQLKKSQLWQAVVGLVAEPETVGIAFSQDNSEPIGFVYGETAKFVTLRQLCDYEWSVMPHLREQTGPYYRPKKGKFDPEYIKYSFGLRACCIVLVRLLETVTSLHRLGVRMGNLRPEDVAVKLEPLSEAEANARAKGKKPEESSIYPVGKGFLYADVRLLNPEAWAIDCKDLRQDYAHLDEDFIHPKYLPGMLAGDNQARLDNDWYSYSMLMAWVFGKVDPFAGMLKSEPSADRKRRMELSTLVWSTHVKLDDPMSGTGKSMHRFVEVALNRLSESVSEVISSALLFLDISQPPANVLLTLCDELIRCPQCKLAQHKTKGSCVNCHTPTKLDGATKVVQDE